jgi:hypothetical protein
MPTQSVIPSAGAGYSRTGTGWATQSSGGYAGGPFDYSGTAGDTATFAFTLPAPGSYRLAIAYVPDVNRSPDVGLVVEDGGTPVLTRTLDQTVAPADFAYGGSAFTWLSGPLAFATTAASVTLSVPGGPYTIADAVYLADATATTPTVSTFAKAVNYHDLLPPIVLAAPHAAGAATLALPAGAGTRLGTLPADRIFRVTALKFPGTTAEEVLGIYDATGIDVPGDTLTGVSGAEGFANVALPAGTTVDVRWTAQDVEDHSAAINALEAAVALQAIDPSVVRTHGDQVISGRKSFPDGIEGIRPIWFVGGAFLVMPASGASGIGTSTANPWVAYCHDDGNWFADAHAGDVAYRNIAGSLLFGTDPDGSTFAVTPSGVVAAALVIGSLSGVLKATSGVVSTAAAGVDYQAAGSYLTALTGDVTASGPGSAAATVAAIKGRTVATTAPSDGQVLTWVASTSRWAPAAVPGGMAIGGAVSGGTAGRVLFEGAGPVLADDTNLTYDPATGILRAFGLNILFSLTISTLSLSSTAASVEFAGGGNRMLRDASTGSVSLKCQNFAGAGWIISNAAGNAGTSPLAVVGASGQTANLQEWRSDTGAVLGAVGPTGALTLGTLTGLLGATSGVISTATAGTDYLTPTGSGAGLTALNASALASGTVPTARLPAANGRLAATVTTTSSTLGTNALTGLGFAIGVSEVWTCEWNLTVTGSTAGMKFDVIGPASPTDLRISIIGNTSAITATSAETIVAFSTASAAYVLYATTSGQVRIVACINNGANAGTVQLRFGSATNTQSNSVLIDSYMTARRIG